MKILVIGQGGREHALVWKLAQSPKVEKIFCAPGNGGISQMATCVSISEEDFAGLTQFVKDEGIDLAVVGPENPLLNGIVDFFESRGLVIYGPSQQAALIEGSKEFAKDLMKKYGIPTAEYESFTEYESAVSYVREKGAPIVVKADGLAAGKGVVVAHTLQEAEAAITSMMKDGIFGEAGSKVVIEEFLEGEEMTLLSFVDGEIVRPMVPSQDHKPVYDGDKGPNTGGMGTYSPVPHMDSSLIFQIVENIVKPTAKAMVEENRPFRGILYTGLMITKNGPKVIEYNARFGDPETQVVLPRLESDLLDIIVANLQGELASVEIKWKEDAAVCVIMASRGYPGKYENGKVIEGLTRVSENIMIFHAGTKLENGKLATCGGRVLGVAALGSSIQEARNKVYKEIDHVTFEGAHYRKDIAEKALKGQ